MKKEDIELHNRLWYYKTYNNLINKGLKRGLKKKDIGYYVERHHILPKCMGGKNSSSNYVMLTYREHIIAHLLLQRIYPDNKKLITSAHAMLFTPPKSIRADEKDKRLSTRMLEHYKKLFSESRKGPNGRKHSEETKRKISEINKGRKFTPEQSKAHSIKMKNRVITDEWKRNISKGMTGKKHPHKSPTMSEELLKRKIELCKSRTGEKHPNSKKIKAPNGKIYNSITECAKDLNLQRSEISKKVNHDPNSGFTFIQ